MPAAVPPADEHIRLETLRSYQILDTPPDRSFERLVELAAEHFDVAISLVSIVDESRQWFKAAVGLDVRETPRDVAFCAHAILHPTDVTVIEDAAADARFADNPLVLGDPSIRFYAGAPILAENGQPLGTLCLIDRKPRRLDGAGRQFLANLAANAASMLELHRRNRVLSASSGLDPLTGLANRTIFDAALSKACSAAAAGGAPFGLVALDLDRFKSVNDTFGHAAGDAVLCAAAERLTRVVRGRDLVARLGGDEFAVLVAGPIDLAGLSAVSMRMVAALNEDVSFLGHDIPLRASLGVALAPCHGTDPGSLAHAADLALYRGKRSGGQGLIIAGQGAGDSHPTLADELRAAIAHEELALYWQPYFSARTGEATGFEALLRWTRASGGAIPPNDIVAMAENGGFILELDRMVLRKACREAASWRRPLNVSVNASAASFSGGDLVGLVAAVLEETGLAPGRLTLELTEGTLVKHTRKASERIEGLHRMGVRVALDDFGTGYASLGYLCTFDFDTLKLDRAFVQGLGSNPRAEAVAKAVLALGRALDMAICAEGVETREQMHFLQQEGCDLLQGFLLGRPQRAIDWTVSSAAMHVITAVAA